MIRLVAVVDDGPAAARALFDLTDRDLVIVGRDPATCLGLQWPEPPPEPDGAALRQFNGLIQALMDTCTVLPFRFWAAAQQTQKIDRWLSEQSARLVALMGRVRGRVELAVRASVESAGSATPAGSGRAYLEGLRRSQQAHPALLGMHSALAGISADARVLSADGARLAAAYLVDAGRVPGFCRAVDAAAGASPGVCRRTVTGPWAPYSFVDLPDGVVEPGRRGRG